MIVEKIRKGLLSYIKLEGYTKKSYAKKCYIDENLFKLFLEGKKEFSHAELKYIVDKTIISQGLNFNILKEYAKKEAELIKNNTKEILEEELLYKSIDESRVEPFLQELKELWTYNTDLKFGQLIEIVVNNIAIKETNINPFHIGDDKWIEAIRKTRKLT